MTSPSVEELAGRSYADYATDVMRDRIITLDIPPGTPINDDLIGKELGLGRTPVREAIKRLEAEHLVVIYPRRGTFAAGTDITELAHITELRVLLEPLAAERAARVASSEDRARLRDLAHRLTEVDSASFTEMMRCDLEVHRLVYTTSGNPHLEELLIRYDNLATRIWCLVADRLSNVGDHIAEHIELLELIAAGEGELAAKAAREHVESFDRMIRSTI